MKNLIWLLFSFKGRINRKGWWFGVLLIFSVFVFLLGLGTFYLHFAGGNPSLNSKKIGRAVAIFTKIFPWLSVALNTKRLHDHNWNGVWQMLYMIPYHRWLIAERFRGDNWWDSAILFGGIAMVVVLGFTAGKAEENRFDEPRTK